MDFLWDDANEDFNSEGKKKEIHQDFTAVAVNVKEPAFLRPDIKSRFLEKPSGPKPFARD